MLTNYNQIINLTNHSYIKLSFLEKPLLDYSDYNYDKLKNLIKTNNSDKSNVMVFNKDYNNPKLIEEKTHRWFKSYLNTPKYHVVSNKSYMFSGSNKNEIIDGLSNLYYPYYDYFKKINNNYNQIVVNYYETIEDFIPMHRDWTYNMIPNYEISILTLNNKNNNINRVFSIENVKTKEIINIELFHGLIITMGGYFQHEYRHGILKTNYNNNNSKNTRLGITFRQFIV
tara:strand:+ start:7627 stop:8310 length:684 start_codon:yes stop_codon:yes gene_type:complete